MISNFSRAVISNFFSVVRDAIGGVILFIMRVEDISPATVFHFYSRVPLGTGGNGPEAEDAGERFSDLHSRIIR